MKAERVVWSKGDFGQVAKTIWEVGERVVELAELREGEDVLDVACGTGNAAIRAAGRGARVTGLDIVPELLEQGTTLAAEAGVDVEWVEGDAENLPFEDGSFDVVVSTFGCMFAPDHRKTAGEIARVLRPGGRIAIASWTPEGKTGEFFKTIGSHMPTPPEGFEPPPLWGVEGHVTEIFAGTGVEPVFSREEVVFKFDSPEHALETFENYFGPIVAAKEALEPQGRWQALADDLLAYWRAEMKPTDDGRQGYAGQYLVALGSKSA